MTVQIEILPPGQEGAMRQLFEDVFGHRMSAAAWSWKYDQGPRLGRIHVAARDDQGGWLGHAGVNVFPGMFRSERIAMAQLGDVMVAPVARGGLGADAVYPRLMAAVREQLQQRFPGAYAYGFPGLRPCRLGERIGYYRRLYACESAEFPAPAPAGWRPWGWSVRPATEWDQALLDALWSRIAPRQDRPLVARDGAYMAWRYRDHPECAYRLWWLRRAWRVEGWMVTRPLANGRLIVVDALLPFERCAPEAGAALWRAVSGGSEPVTAIETWLPHVQPRSATPIMAIEFRTEDGCSPWPAPSFQPGDTDVF